VHVQRVRHLAKAIDPDVTVVADLDQLEEFGEACRLSNGYWIPVRPSVVVLDQAALVIAPNSYSELRRRLGNCDHGKGLMRVCPVDACPSWPRQTVDHWLRRPRSLRRWAKHQIGEHRARLMPSRADAERLEFYCGSPSRLGYKRRWVSLRDCRREASSQELLLLRERAGGRTVRHFVGTQCGLELTQEATLTCDLLRLQFGLDMLAGDSQRLRPRRDGEVVWIRLSRPLPKEERKLFVAVCEVIQEDRYIDVGIPGYAEATCYDVLKNLGFAIEENRD